MHNTVEHDGRTTGIGSPNQLLGAAVESFFDCFAMMQGWVVSQPCHPLPWDRVIQRPDNGMKFERVQVKKAMYHASIQDPKRNARRYPTVPLTTKTRRGDVRHYQASDFDLLAVVWLERGGIWIIPWSERFAGRQRLTLNAEVNIHRLWFDWNRGKCKVGEEIETHQGTLFNGS